MKRIASIVLSLILVLSCVSAFGEAAFTPAETYETGERIVFAGDVTLEEAAAGGGVIDTEVYAGIEGKDYTDEKVYTYNDYTASITSSSDWNPHTWETNDDSNLLDMMTMGFYAFKLNSDMSGYAIVPEMAADYPVDVTAEYVGTYGVEEGETSKAFRIALNQSATWENGEAITADDYIYSMQQQLNPKMLNRRADSYYSSEFIVVNAKNYLYSAQAGQTGYNLMEGTVQENLDAGADLYVDMWGFWGLEGCVDADGNECPQYASMNDDTMYRDPAVEDETADEAWVSGKYLFDTYFAPGMPYESYANEYVYAAYVIEGATWDEVGLVKVDDYTIDIILEKPVSEAAFYVPYNLSSNWLVYEPLYEECKSFFDAEGKEVETEEEAATVTTNYCKSLETTIGYGPYKLTYFELDKQYTFERNENWYGYSDGKHLGQYQTDIYTVKVIAEHSTAMLAFESGEIEAVSLQAEDMEKYASSQYIHYTPESFTTKVTFNTDYEKLLGRGTNSQILVIDEFREGFAKALDRNHFATAFTAAGTAGYGILNYMYVYDPFTGATYRDNAAAEAVLCDVYGVTYGEGGEYETLEDAYAAITGYDMEGARAAMAVAYDKAIEAGIWDGESPIEIEFRVYTSDTIYVQMFTYFDTQLKEACVGTGFEGKVSMKMTVDADYYNTNYSGAADAIFTTWGGSSMSPFSTFYSCYCDGADGSGNQMEYGFDTSAVMLTFNVDGTEMTASLHDWANWGNNADVAGITDVIGNFTDYSYDTRCQFMAGVERGLLAYYTTTPIYYRNVASLTSQKINYAADSYIQLVAFGGIPYITYNYDDAEWADYIANNTLEY